MSNTAASRFKFIGHALAGDGPFRPIVSTDGDGLATLAGTSYLIRYPRESDAKFARRCELAFYASPLMQACSRFVGYLQTKPPTRTIEDPLYQAMADDIDGKGNSLDEFFAQFLIQFKARGTMLLLVDMDAAPADRAPNQAAQIAQRVAPYWSMVKPEDVTDYELGDDGKFAWVEFAGNWTSPAGERIACTWRFDRTSWAATKKDATGTSQALAQGNHPLGECPLLICTEGGDFPHFGPFAAIADLSKRLFNLDSELDEILRGQTFSLLTMQVEDGTNSEQKLAVAQTAGQTVSTANMLVHSGSTPAFIAPPDGPAATYLQRIEKMRLQIDEIGLNVATINQQESGVAMKMRFQTINASLVACANRVDGLERRAWALSQKWLQLTTAPDNAWADDYDIADVEVEMQILLEMQQAAMPRPVIVEQQKRIVQLQFGGLADEKLDELMEALDEDQRGVDGTPEGGGNVVPLPDRNAPVREAILRSLGVSNGGG
jgi:hypothetical protein